MNRPKPPIELSDAHWQIVREILERDVPGVEVLAFGSRARGSIKPYSDLDLALRGAEPLGLSVLAKLENDFGESLLPFKVDVTDWHHMGDAFRRAIADDLVLVLPAEPAA